MNVIEGSREMNLQYTGSCPHRYAHKPNGSTELSITIKLPQTQIAII